MGDEVPVVGRIDRPAGRRGNRDGRAADDLDEAGTLARYEETNKKLVAALRELSTDLEGTAAQMQQPEFTDLFQSTRGLSFESWTKVNARLADLRDEGIAVQPLDRH